MSRSDPKADLHHYLQMARDVVVWKLEGLTEYDARRPLTPTGTNLLGLVKHLAMVEAGYFGSVFGRPLPDAPAWFGSDEDNADMWATADESREEILDLYETACRHADDTIAALPLAATCSIPWWPEEQRETSLHRLLVHMIAETHRHAGHADIVRELVDGAVGYREARGNLPPGDGAWWAAYRERVEAAARDAGERTLDG